MIEFFRAKIAIPRWLFYGLGFIALVHLVDTIGELLG